ncbi:MAG TPA: FAD-dependent oxidoreductase [Candidatus Eisenbacteria bacterium]|nr:FAD-dependent oxidoreductase [Candidatus Eisenbacteria bacterium]
MSLPKRAQVVVIGGGVIGASVAHHLAERGVRDVVVLDRADGPGRGSTGAATGGYRAQYGTAINIRLSLLARGKLLAFEEETGVDPGYEQAGYLWLASTPAALEALAAGHRLQREEGLREAMLVSPGQAASINPHVNLDGVLGGAFCPTDGFVRPLRILEGYRAAAERRGVRFVWGAEVVAMRRDGGGGGRVLAVDCAKGAIECDAVVNSAGAWAKSVAAMAGVDLPVEPLRRQVLPTLPTESLPGSMPMTIWADDGYHLRVRDGRALLLWPSPGAPERPFDASVDPEWMARVEAMTSRRVPALAGVAADRSAAWGGLYEISPDKHAILGWAPECENLYLANGSSGHGVMHAPALGQLLAEIMTGVDGRARALDAHPLRPSRFTEGAPIEGPALL